MANNRLLLYCKQCHGILGLAKYYPVSWASHLEASWLNEFFEEHQECLENSGKELGFEADKWGLTTESTWDGGIDYRNKPYKLIPKDKLEEWEKANDLEKPSK